MLSWRFWSGLTAGLLAAGGVALTSYLAAETDRRNRRARNLEALAAEPLSAAERIDLEERRDSLNRRGPVMEQKQWASMGATAGLVAISASLLLWELFDPQLEQASARVTISAHPAPATGRIAVHLSW